MSTEYKVLGQLLSVAGSTLPVYTVPSGKQALISTIAVCNQASSATTFRVAAHHSSLAVAAQNYLVYDTELAANDTVFLTLGVSLAELQSISFRAANSNVSVTLFGLEQDAPEDEYAFSRPGEWPVLTPIPSGTQKVQGVHAVFNHDSNFIAVNAAGNYTVDWGDGSSANFNSGVQAEHKYTYASISGPVVGSLKAQTVALTDAGDLVTLVGHGYLNGTPVSFSSVTGTTGITADAVYYIVNKTADTFQISATLGGSAVALTTNGSGSLYLPQYKTVVVTITPNGGDLTSIDLNKRHSQSSLEMYNSGWLDLEINGAYLTAITVSKSSISVYMDYLKRVRVGENAITSWSNVFNACSDLEDVDLVTSSGTNFSYMFYQCYSLKVLPLLDTHAGTNFQGMLQNCGGLRTIPPLDTRAGTDLSYMFYQCYNLVSIPLLSTGLSTTLAAMFYQCRNLKTIPLLDTHSCLSFASMFQECTALEEIPLLNTASGTNFSGMFQGCYSLHSIPLLNTAAGTNFTNMFKSAISLQEVPLLDVSIGTIFSSMFSGCASLSKGALKGTAQNISYASCRLSATELDLVYSNLASGVTAKTITVTGNYGTTGDTPSIATSKGWTVTG